MKLEQFDKLRALIDELTIRHRQQKFRIVHLEKENSEMKEQLESIKNLPEHIDLNKLNALKIENERLKKKNQQVLLKVNRLIARIEQKTPGHSSGGVDS